MANEDVLTFENNKFQVQNLTVSTAQKHMFQEILTNAVDRLIYTNDISRISVQIQDNLISIENNGDTMLIQKYRDTDDYIPTLFAQKEFCSTNYDNSNRLTGGLNGIGMKAVNFNSNLFIIECDDTISNFSQQFNQGEAEDPIICPSVSVEPYTKISFVPRFDRVDKYVQIFMAKTICAKLWAGHFLHRNIDVTFNGQSLSGDYHDYMPVKVLDMDFVAQYPWKMILHGQLDSEQKKVVKHLSMINGMNIGKGKHINVFMQEIHEYIKKELNGASYNVQNLNIVVFAEIPNPEFNTQSKERFNPDSKWTYPVLSAQELKIIFDFCQTNHLISSSVKLSATNYDGYFPASKLGKESTLFIAEGNSAIATINHGMKYIKNNHRYGIFSLQGVIINALRQVKECKNQTFIKDKLKENKIINSLIQAIGLKYNQKADISKLNYGKIIVMTDQDIDGVGNIFSLLLTFLYSFWKELYHENFITRLQTPIIRAFEKEKHVYKHENMKYIEFYDENQFNQWIKEESASKYDIKYYKGLAGHYGVFVRHIFDNMDKNILNYLLDHEADVAFNNWFGKCAQNRKIMLNKPTNDQLEQQLYSSPTVNCTDHLNVETHKYKLDDIKRKIFHAVDGLNISRRKILYAMIIDYLKQPKISTNDHHNLPDRLPKEYKVFELSGIVTSISYYHHGNESLQQTIIKMAQNYYESKDFNLLLPLGEFGSRYYQGKDAGSARYISTELDQDLVDALYPFQDLPNLRYSYEDGNRVEPAYFVPVIPTILIDHYKTVTNGWNCQIYPRCINHLIELSRECVIDDSTSCINYIRGRYTKMTDGYNYDCANNIKDIPEYTFGIVTQIDANKLKITKLPYKTNIKKYVQELKSNPNITDVVLYIVGDNDTDIDVEYTCSYEEIVPQLKLWQIVKQNIQCINVQDSVSEITNYRQIFDEWYVQRKNMYMQRIRRKELLHYFKVLKLTNIVKYIELITKIDIREVDDYENLLVENGFNKLNNKNHNNISAENLHEFLYETNATYEYLRNIRISDCIKGSYARYCDKLKQQKCKIYSDNSYKYEWLQDIEKLEYVIKNRQNE